MLLYMSFLFVYLLSITGVNFSDVFKDLQGNKVDFNSYDDIKPFLFKCCENEHVMAPGDACKEAKHVDYRRYPIFRWIDGNKPIRTNKTLNEDLIFVRNDKILYMRMDDFKEFYILEDGSLKIKGNNETNKWIYIPPLDFCVDYQIVSETEDNIQLEFVYKLYDEKKEALMVANKATYVAIGFAVTLIMFSLKMRFCPPAMKKHIQILLLAFFCTVLLGYLVKAAEFLLYVFDLKECRIISPMLYFFVLSSFIWTCVLSYHLFRFVRELHAKKYEILKEDKLAKFMEYSIYAWGVPFAMIMAILYSDRTGFYDIFSIGKSPFDSCFTDEKQTKIYMHVPIAILSAFVCVNFIRSMWYVPQIRGTIHNKPVSKTCLISRQRLAFNLKLVIVVSMSCLLEFTPNVPVILYYTVNICNLVCWSALILLLIARRSLCNPFSWSKPNDGLHPDNGYEPETRTNIFTITTVIMMPVVTLKERPSDEQAIVNSTTEDV